MAKFCKEEGFLTQIFQAADGKESCNDFANAIQTQWSL
jgi:hypothetical protein